MFFRGKKDEEIEKLDEEAPKKQNAKKIEKEDDGLVWDKKRILIAVVILIAALFIASQLKKMFLPNTSILGESTVKTASEIEKPEIEGPGVDLESNVTSKFEDVKESIVNLDPEEIASSSPQIQKVIKDIEGLKDLPADQARNTCMKICSGI